MMNDCLETTYDAAEGTYRKFVVTSKKVAVREMVLLDKRTHASATLKLSLTNDEAEALVKWVINGCRKNMTISGKDVIVDGDDVL